MRSFPPIAGQSALAQQFINLRRDAAGGSNLLVHQQLGFFTLSTNPGNGKTLTLDINGTNVVFTFVTVIGSAAGNVLIGASAAATCANLLALLNQPQTTTSTGVALSAANQLLVSYLSYALAGTTLTVSSNSNALYAPLTSFSASTNATSDSWTSQTMQLYVEPGVVYVNGTRVIFAGGSTPTVTAPSSHPRIDVLTIDSSGTLAWTTGTENASPSAPTYPANKVPLIELWNVVGETQLLDNDNQSGSQGFVYNDVRAFLHYPVNPGALAVDLIPSADGGQNLGSPSFEWNNLYVKSGIFLNGVTINSQLTAALTAGSSFSTAQAAALAPFQSDGGVLIDGTPGGAHIASGTTITSSITVGANANRVLVVFVDSSTQNISSVTYGGVAMTQIDSQVLFGSGSNYRGASYILVAPATGANNLVVTFAGSSSDANALWFSLYNAAQTSQPEAHNSDKGSSSNLNVTTIANGAFVITGVASQTGTNGGSATYENSTTTSTITAWDSGQVFPAGTTVTLTKTGTTQGCFMLSIAPASSVSYLPVLASSAAPTNQYFNKDTPFLGFAAASITGGTNGTFVTAGIAVGFSGLLPGSLYYLNDTPGTIGPTPGTNSRKVGIALSTTTLLITNEP